MINHAEQPISFYCRHLISLEIGPTRLAKQRGSLDGVQPEELWAHDQDHFGGRPTTRYPNAPASVQVRVADFCVGLGGPARC